MGDVVITAQATKVDLPRGVSSISGTNFITINGHGFLCAEYFAGAKKFEAYLNVYLNEFLKELPLKG